MLKLLGCLLLLGGGTTMGMLGVRTGRREIALLRDLVSVLMELGDEIRLSRTPLPRLFEKLSRSHGSETAALLTAILERTRSGDSLAAAWQQETDRLPLAPRQRIELQELGPKFSGDEESICNGIALVSMQLTRALEEKESARADREKRWTAVCVSSAALLMILLM